MAIVAHSTAFGNMRKLLSTEIEKMFTHQCEPHILGEAVEELDGWLPMSGRSEAMAISPVWWDCVANQSQGYMPRWWWVNTLIDVPQSLDTCSCRQGTTKDKRSLGPQKDVKSCLTNNPRVRHHTKQLFIDKITVSSVAADGFLWPWLHRAPAGSSAALYPPSTAPRATSTAWFKVCFSLLFLLLYPQGPLKEN